MCQLRGGDFWEAPPKADDEGGERDARGPGQGRQGALVGRADHPGFQAGHKIRGFSEVRAGEFLVQPGGLRFLSALLPEGRFGGRAAGADRADPAGGQYADAGMAEMN